jgi:hypothetical protein
MLFQGSMRIYIALLGYFISVGIIIGGCVLISKSTVTDTSTCADWPTINLTYQHQYCNYRKYFVGVFCNATEQCVCQDITLYKITCLDMPPIIGPSDSYIAPGISMIVIGIVGLIGIIIVTWLSCE